MQTKESLLPFHRAASMTRCRSLRSLRLPMARQWRSGLAIVLVAGTVLSPFDARAQTVPSDTSAPATSAPAASPEALAPLAGSSETAVSGAAAADPAASNVAESTAAPQTAQAQPATVQPVPATPSPSPAATPAASAAQRGTADLPLRTWHFAEGNARSQFDTYFTLLNLSERPASVMVQYNRDDGIRLVQWLGIEPRARVSLKANDIVGAKAFGASFFSDQDIVVERSTTSGPGQNAQTTSGFAPNGEREWYFAEGTTRGKVTTYFVTQNLSDSPATVNATFVRDNGSKETRSFGLGPRARDAFRMNDLVQDSSFAAMFRSDQDVVIERTIMTEGERQPTKQERGDKKNGQTDEGTAMLNNSVGILGGLGFVGTADQAGSRSWQFAEGSTRIPYQTHFVLFNPNQQSTEVRMRFRLQGGETRSRSLWIGGQSRMSFDTRDTVPSADFATSIETDVPIVVERTYQSSGDGLYGALGYTGSAVRRDSKDWYFAEGNTNSQIDTYFVIFNMSDRSAQVRGTFYADGQQPREKTLDVGAGKRIAVRANDFVPGAFFSSRFRSDQNVVIERTFYLPGGSGFTTVGAGIGR